MSMDSVSTGPQVWPTDDPERFASTLGQEHPLSFIEALLDPAMLVLSLWALALWHEGALPAHYTVLSVVVFAMTYPGSSHLQSSLRRLVVHTLINWSAVVALLLATGLATGYVDEFSADALLAWLWLAPMSQIAAHRLLRRLAPVVTAWRGAPRKAVIVGMNAQGLALAQRIGRMPYANVAVAGFFDDRAAARLQPPPDATLIDQLAALPAYVQAHGVQIIYLSLPMASQPRILQVLDGLKDTTASIYFVPDMFVTDLIQGRTTTVCGIPVISVCETPFRGMAGLVKRLWDVLLASAILLLVAPVMLGIAIGIKLGSPGPVIFRQRRYGLDGKEIVVYKFRSMTVTEDGERSYTQVTRGDARVTRLGAFIRKTSLDELPQFINVLQGRMSVVGPRPHAIAVNEQYRKLISGYMVRHKVRPGITGWAQVNGYRGGDDLPSMRRRIQYDLDYLRNWSLPLDLRIVARTVGVVFKDSQAF
jgi:putative colanic acid biosynthesis UDP-glucose lipid carrier transferase